MDKDEIIIRQLLERFMAGETTPQENDQIADWFKSHPTVSDDLRDYQAMFGYLDAGMPWDFASPKAKKHGMRPWWIALSAAASIAVAFMVFYPRPSESPANHPVATLSDKNYAIPPAVDSDSTSSNTELSDSIQEKEMQPAKSRKRIYHKYQFEIAPPTRQLAAIPQQESESADTLLNPSGIGATANHQLVAHTEQHYTPEQIEKLTDQALERMLARQDEMLTELFGKDPSTNLFTSQDIETE